MAAARRLWRKRLASALTASASAAPQVGVLRRVFIMDFGDGKGVISGQSAHCGAPRQTGRTWRAACPARGIRITPPSAPGQNGGAGSFRQEFTFEGRDLSARCVCHEYDHLDGILFKQHVVRMLDPEDTA